ncbi:hypothetical protein V6Z12_A12G236700 [Gossypium hirsutum]
MVLTQARGVFPSMAGEPTLMQQKLKSRIRLAMSDGPAMLVFFKLWVHKPATAFFCCGGLETSGKQKEEGRRVLLVFMGSRNGSPLR